MKKVLSVYTHSMTTIYLSLSAKVAISTFFMKSPLLVRYTNKNERILSLRLTCLFNIKWFISNCLSLKFIKNQKKIPFSVIQQFNIKVSNFGVRWSFKWRKMGTLNKSSCIYCLPGWLYMWCVQFRKKLILSGNLRGASCGSHTSRREAPCPRPSTSFLLPRNTSFYFDIAPPPL